MAMLEKDTVFAGSIPENYDRCMAPLIFEPFAADLAQRAASFFTGRRFGNRRGHRGFDGMLNSGGVALRWVYIRIKIGKRLSGLS